MVRSPYGYLIPQVDGTQCVDCGKCEKTCPVLKPSKKEYKERTLFSAYSIDNQIRDKGSSGSIFYHIALYIIEKGGVVFGAAMDENLKLKHVMARNVQELSRLTKSKYFQSDTREIYIKVKNLLDGGNLVMFCGTPCQCNALYKFVPESKKDNLILVDFICHGVPSQENFDKSIHRYEAKVSGKVLSYEFRPKNGFGLHGYRITYKDLNNETCIEEGKYYKQPFYLGFKLYIAFRQSCYHCKFVGKERVSDITLGDFWGLSHVDRKVKDEDKGYSMVIINSDKGSMLFEAIYGDIETKSFDLEVAVRNNSSYVRPVKDSILSKAFRYSYKNLPYSVTETLFFSLIILTLKTMASKSKRLIYKLIKTSHCNLS